MIQSELTLNIDGCYSFEFFETARAAISSRNISPRQVLRKSTTTSSLTQTDVTRLNFFEVARAAFFSKYYY